MLIRWANEGDLPAPYEGYEEFLWFVERMREELAG